MSSLGKHWKLSEETKAKMRKPKAARTEEHRKNLGEALKGKAPWNKGRKGLQRNHNISGLNIKGVSPWNKGLKGFRAGERSHLWKGGITPINHKIRSSMEYKEWRKSVFERDGYCCTACGYKREAGAERREFNADHIKPFALYPELRFELSNGRTLCVPCHRQTPSYLNRWNLKGSIINL